VSKDSPRGQRVERTKPDWFSLALLVLSTCGVILLAISS
jgi:hypothetical protein